MKTQTYIAVFLTLVFMVKFIAVDADGLNVVFDEDDVTFVNQMFCETKGVFHQSVKTTDFSQADQFASLVIPINGFCTSQYQFVLFSWKTNYQKPITTFNEHSSSELSHLYLDSLSPPPRLIA